MKAIAVIGTGWGDESKGKLVDYYSDNDTVVVRINGGANAGHTVVRNNIRHVFHHFGSGTLQGAKTYLSEYFIHNPILFMEEFFRLETLGYHPIASAHPNGFVTVPWDIMLNQISEESRGVARHGSCGVGLNETIQRNKFEEFSLTINDLKKSKSFLKEKLLHIMTDWVPKRLNDLAFDPSSDWLKRLVQNDIIEPFISYCEQMDTQIGISTEPEPTSKIIFEGAQGLLLDQDHRFFPHVTHSHTGLKNVSKLIPQFNINELDVVYVTRAYATRHGAGPFPHETDITYEDKTNVPNAWQGSLRFGELDLDLLTESISNDCQHVNLPIRKILSVNHLDQLDSVHWWQNGVRQTDSIKKFIEKFVKTTNINECLLGFGPKASDINRL